MDKKYVKIEWSRLRELLKAEETLDALYAAGVDNWEGFGLQWESDVIDFERVGDDDKAWDQFIAETYEQVCIEQEDKTMNRVQIPSFYTLTWDVNRDEVEYYDIMPYLVSVWEEDKVRKHKIWFKSLDDDTKEPATVEEWKKAILAASRYRFWFRCEYEIIVSGWPVEKRKVKLDVFNQINANIDVVTKLFMEYVSLKES